MYEVKLLLKENEWIKIIVQEAKLLLKNNWRNEKKNVKVELFGWKKQTQKLEYKM